MPDDDVEIEDVQAIRETEKALLCQIKGEEIWVPRSQIREESDVKDAGDDGTLVVSNWFATKEGLE